MSSFFRSSQKYQMFHSSSYCKTNFSLIFILGPSGLKVTKWGFVNYVGTVPIMGLHLNFRPTVLSNKRKSLLLILWMPVWSEPMKYNYKNRGFIQNTQLQIVGYPYELNVNWDSYANTLLKSLKGSTVKSNSCNMIVVF